MENKFYYMLQTEKCIDNFRQEYRTCWDVYEATLDSRGEVKDRFIGSFEIEDDAITFIKSKITYQNRKNKSNISN